MTAHIEWTLRHLTKNTIEAHKIYVDQLKQQVTIERNITKHKLADARAEFRRHNDLYAKYQQLQLESPDDYKRHHKGGVRVSPRVNDSKQSYGRQVRARFATIK